MRAWSGVGRGPYWDRRTRSEAGRKRHIVVDTEFRRQVKFPTVIWVDAAYRAVVSWIWVMWAWVLEVVSRPSGQTGFAVQPKRWIVERTIPSSEAFVKVAMIHLMVRRPR